MKWGALVDHRRADEVLRNFNQARPPLRVEPSVPRCSDDVSVVDRRVARDFSGSEIVASPNTFVGETEGIAE